MMKYLIFALGCTLMTTVQLFGQVVTESFELGQPDGVKDVASNEMIGNFSFTAFNGNEAVDNGMIITKFNGKSSLMLGMPEKVTELRITGKEGADFRLIGFEALANYVAPHSDNSISVTGYKGGLQVTEPISVEVKEVFGHGEFYDLQQYPDFAQIDEIRIKAAKKLEISIEQLVYEVGDGGGLPYMATR